MEGNNLVYNVEGFIKTMSLYVSKLNMLKLVGQDEYQSAKEIALYQMLSEINKSDVESLNEIISILEMKTNVEEIFEK